MGVDKRKAVLNDAVEAVSKFRNSQYGEPEDNFALIASLWSNLGFRSKRGDGINSTDVAVMMAAMKLARLRYDPTHRDSWVDVAGYAACGYDVAQVESTQDGKVKPDSEYCGSGSHHE